MTQKLLTEEEFSLEIKKHLKNAVLANMAANAAATHKGVEDATSNFAYTVQALVELHTTQQHLYAESEFDSLLQRAKNGEVVKIEKGGVTYTLSTFAGMVDGQKRVVDAALNLGVEMQKEVQKSGIDQMEVVWQLFQINPERNEGYTLNFDTYEDALDAVNTDWYHQIELRSWELED